jgi:hypothetical protein
MPLDRSAVDDYRAMSRAIRTKSLAVAEREGAFGS